MEGNDNMIEEVYNKLQQKYNDECIDKIPSILASIEKNNSKSNIIKELDNLQDICNILYSKYGATDEVIFYQAMINTLRNKYDIPDENELIYNHPDGRFVQ